DKIKNREFGSVEIAQRKDASATIRVSKDEMYAFITTIPPSGGKQLTSTMIESILTDNNIDLQRVESDALAEVIKEGTVENLLIASGILPVNGGDSSFIPQVES